MSYSHAFKTANLHCEKYIVLRLFVTDDCSLKKDMDVFRHQYMSGGDRIPANERLNVLVP